MYEVYQDSISLFANNYITYSKHCNINLAAHCDDLDAKYKLRLRKGRTLYDWKRKRARMPSYYSLVVLSHSFNKDVWFFLNPDFKVEDYTTLTAA